MNANGEESCGRHSYGGIILASASPQRRYLLRLLGLSFCIVEADVDESPLDEESPLGLAMRLGMKKAEAVALESPAAVVIGCDTLVVLDGVPLGKPRDAQEATEMLERLRAREHTVCSGLAIVCRDRNVRSVQTALTPVRMRDYSDDEVRRYVASGDPLERAGSYAIQHDVFAPVASLGGCWANVVGLPLCHVYRVLRDWAMPVPVHPQACCPYASAEGCQYAAAIVGAART